MLQSKEGRRMASGEEKYFLCRLLENIGKEREGGGAQRGSQVFTGTYWCGTLCRHYLLSKGTGCGDSKLVCGMNGKAGLRGQAGKEELEPYFVLMSEGRLDKWR